MAKRKYLTNTEIAMAFGGYDFRLSDMIAVCKAQRVKTVRELGFEIQEMVVAKRPNCAKTRKRR